MTAKLILRFALALTLGAYWLLSGVATYARESDNPTLDAGTNGVPSGQAGGPTHKPAPKTITIAAQEAKPIAVAEEAPGALEEDVAAPASARWWLVALLLVALAWALIYARTELPRQRRFKESGN